MRASSVFLAYTWSHVLYPALTALISRERANGGADGSATYEIYETSF
jgi:hypothetical protein